MSRVYRRQIGTKGLRLYVNNRLVARGLRVSDPNRTKIRGFRLSPQPATVLDRLKDGEEVILSSAQHMYRTGSPPAPVIICYDGATDRPD
jgi:hypothetical protein